MKFDIIKKKRVIVDAKSLFDVLKITTSYITFLRL